MSSIPLESEKVAPQSRKIRVLIVEDSEDDAKLMAHTLAHHGYGVEWERVETDEAMRAALQRQSWDVILADYRLPHFSGPAAFEVLKQTGLGLPFIVVSATIGEEAAVALLKAGADDFVMKGNLVRLVPAIERGIKDAETRRQLHQQSAALNAAANAIFITDRDGRIEWVNHAFSTLTGYNIEEAVGNNPRMLKSGKHDQVFYRTLWDTILAGKVWRGEMINRRKDGSFYSEEMTITPLKDDRGEITHFIAVKQDITERIQAEENMRQSEHKYRELFENLTDAAFLFEMPHHRILDCNLQAEALLGKTRAEILGLHETELHPPGEVERNRELFSRCYSEPHCRDFEDEVVSTDGTRTPVSISSTALVLYGRPVVLALFRDVTERKRAEEALRGSEEQMRAITDSAQDAIVMMNPAGQVSYWNPAAERIFGYTSAEAIGQNLHEFIASARYLEAFRAAFPSFQQTGQGAAVGKLLDLEARRKDGKELSVQLSLSAIRMDDGWHAVGILRDMTEHKKLEAQFLRAQRMESIGTLASGVAHDLNNILSPIMMSVPLLRRDLTAEQRDGIVATIEKCAERGAGIVRQVLTFGRGLSGEKHPLQVGTLIKELIKMMKETFPKNIAIESSLERDLWPVIGDATQLHQVLLNLCVNARDAMPEGGKLRLRATNLELDASYASMLPEATPGPHVLLEVSDTGSGIPPEIIERIFDPFFTTKSMGQGTGLGLSTVHGIVKSHGGFIHVDTEPGKGSTFQVYLPASPDHETKPANALPERLPRGHGELVLVVDDEETVRNAVRTVLEAKHYRVLLAADGIEALATYTANAGNVALMITDLMMPVMDGATLIHILRKMAPALPIIAATGLGESPQRSQLKGMGVETVLNKPYSAVTLLQAIHDALHPATSSPTG